MNKESLPVPDMSTYLGAMHAQAEREFTQHVAKHESYNYELKDSNGNRLVNLNRLDSAPIESPEHKLERATRAAEAIRLAPEVKEMLLRNPSYVELLQDESLDGIGAEIAEFIPHVLAEIHAKNVTPTDLPTWDVEEVVLEDGSKKYDIHNYATLGSDLGHGNHGHLRNIVLYMDKDGEFDFKNFAVSADVWNGDTILDNNRRAHGMELVRKDGQMESIPTDTLLDHKDNKGHKSLKRYGRQGEQDWQRRHREGNFRDTLKKGVAIRTKPHASSQKNDSYRPELDMEEGIPVGADSGYSEDDES